MPGSAALSVEVGLFTPRRRRSSLQLSRAFTPRSGVNAWFQRLRDFNAQNLINSADFDGARNLGIMDEPRNPLETLVMCSLHLSCSQRFEYGACHILFINFYIFIFTNSMSTKRYLQHALYFLLCAGFIFFFN